MDKLVNIKKYKNGNISFSLNIYEIYKFFRDVLGFRYAKINNRGFYLKDDGYSFHTVNIDDMRDEFIDYLEHNYYEYEISKYITHVDFLNKFYEKGLPKLGPYLRNTLSSDYSLSLYKKESILRKVDFKFRVEEVLTVFQNKGFELHIIDKYKSIYFRKKEPKKWIVLEANIRNKTEYDIFNLYEIEAENLTKLKKGKYISHNQICYDFKLPDDLQKLNETMIRNPQI